MCFYKKAIWYFYYESMKIITIIFYLSLFTIGFIKFTWYENKELPVLLSYFFCIILGVFIGYKFCYASFMYLRKNDRSGKRKERKRDFYSINN